MSALAVGGGGSHDASWAIEPDPPPPSCPPLLPSAPCAAPYVPQPQAQAAPAPRKTVPTLASGSAAPSSSSSAAPRPHKTRVVPVRQGSVKKRDSAEQVDGGMVGGVLMPGATHAAAAGAKETHPMKLRLLFVDDEPVRTRARARAKVMPPWSGWVWTMQRCRRGHSACTTNLS